MKLKLEMQQGVAILSVAESLVAQDVSVLRAGLNKLIQSGKKQLVLDLTELPAGSIGDQAAKDLVSLPSWAIGFEAQLIIASPQAGVGQAPSREKAIELAGSSLGRLLTLEAKLSAQLKTLQQHKTQLETKLGATAQTPENDVKSLRAQSSELKMLIRTLEDEIKLLLKGRASPVDPGAAAKSQKETLRNTIDPILMRDGVIPT